MAAEIMKQFTQITGIFQFRPSQCASDGEDKFSGQLGIHAGEPRGFEDMMRHLRLGKTRMHGAI